MRAPRGFGLGMAIGCALLAAGWAVPPSAWQSLVERATGGESYFFSHETIRDFVGLVRAAGFCALAAPWLVELLRRVAPPAAVHERIDHALAALLLCAFALDGVA